MDNALAQLNAEFIRQFAGAFQLINIKRIDLNFWTIFAFPLQKLFTINTQG